MIKVPILAVADKLFKIEYKMKLYSGTVSLKNNIVEQLQIKKQKQICPRVYENNRMFTIFRKWGSLVRVAMFKALGLNPGRRQINYLFFYQPRVES